MQSWFTLCWLSQEFDSDLETTSDLARDDHVPSVDSEPVAWVLLVTGLLVNTLFVNQITMENIRTGIWLENKQKNGKNNRYIC